MQQQTTTTATYNNNTRVRRNGFVQNQTKKKRLDSYLHGLDQDRNGLLQDGFHVVLVGTLDEFIRLNSCVWHSIASLTMIVAFGTVVVAGILAQARRVVVKRRIGPFFQRVVAAAAAACFCFGRQQEEECNVKKRKRATESAKKQNHLAVLTFPLHKHHRLGHNPTIVGPTN